MQLGPLHRRLGGATIVVFLLTGVFLRLGFPRLYGDNETVRFLYRANHIYILFAGLVNLALGLQLHSADGGWRRSLQIAGSAALLTAAPLLVAAFFRDPPGGNAERLLTSVGVALVLAGVLLHLPGAAMTRGGR